MPPTGTVADGRNGSQCRERSWLPMLGVMEPKIK
jgi:hypothetical protein